MQKRKILIVDDDPISQQIVGTTLQKHFEVVRESSGAQAAVIAARLKPDLMLLDLHMPNVDGFEVLRNLKSNPVTAMVPVICVSGDVDQQSRDRAISLGATAYFQKPLNLATLVGDLNSSLQSMQAVLESATGQVRFTISPSHFEKQNALKSEIRNRIGGGERCLLLTLTNGAEFSDPFLESAMVHKELVYLQISPSTIAKIPFLQDFRPVIDDINGFLEYPSHDYVLFVDDPHVLMSADGSSASLTRVHLLRELFGEHFNATNFYASRGGMSSVQPLNELAALLTR